MGSGGGMNRQTLFAAALVVGAGASAGAATMVPPGNRSAEQPEVPGASTRRTNEAQTTFEAKYQKIYRLLQRDEALRGRIVAAAEAYDFDPIHIVGAIVGEHTYNVDAYDRLQTYYVKAVAYLRSDISFSYRGEEVTEFARRPQFAPCDAVEGSYEIWSCREAVWDQVFRGRRVDGTDFPDRRFSATFFQPFYAARPWDRPAQPLTALQMSDLAHTYRVPRIDARRRPGVRDHLGSGPDDSLVRRP